MPRGQVDHTNARDVFLFLNLEVGSAGRRVLRRIAKPQMYCHTNRLWGGVHVPFSERQDRLVLSTWDFNLFAACFHRQSYIPIKPIRGGCEPAPRSKIADLASER